MPLGMRKEGTNPTDEMLLLNIIQIHKTMTEIKIKRAYETPEISDGYRMLVDRLWPRGLTHNKLDCQYWAKDVAPSPELREWFHSNPYERWDEFVEKYKAELKANPELEPFVDIVRDQPVVTFVYASKDEKQNEAIVLKEVCDQLIAKQTLQAQEEAQ